MKKAMVILAMAAVFSRTQSLRAEFDCAKPVMTESGLVSGISEDHSCAWKGIPFAAAPVGDLRFKAPEPAPAWSGVRKAEKFGARCMQKGIFTLEVKNSKEGMSEDCLFLNVWRPRKDGTFPVMVWVHGGGYTGGASSTPMYWGDRLAEEGDVVLVSFNYRLNVFGFFSSPALRDEDPHHSTGNYGTLDQLAALAWVSRNISNFGGDPKNVTIFGESAGGFSICTLLATPLAKGLFQRAILESGGCIFTEELEKGYEIDRRLTETLGCQPDDLNCLRKIPAKTLLDKAETGMGGTGNMPHIDGYVLPDTPLAMLRAGNFNQVPFLAGSNRDEFAKAMKLQGKLRAVKPGDYEKALVERLKFSEAEARELAALYPLAEFDNRPVEAYGRMLGADAAMACPTYEGLLAASRHKTDTYYYRFDYDRMKYGKYLGAAHSLEIPFIFDSFDRLPNNLLYNDKNMGPAKELSKIIQGYWLNFAKTGNPNGPGLPQWPMFTPDNQMVQILDSRVRSEKTTIAPRCQFWDTHKIERPH